MNHRKPIAVLSLVFGLCVSFFSGTMVSGFFGMNWMKNEAFYYGILTPFVMWIVGLLIIGWAVHELGRD